MIKSILPKYICTVLHLSHEYNHDERGSVHSVLHAEALLSLQDINKGQQEPLVVNELFKLKHSCV